VRGDAHALNDVMSHEERETRPPPARRLIFLSHASPQDNVFAKWLATQLAIAGYEVWCDVTDLLGGERFWNDITEAIDAYAFRFLFVSTLEGNRKPGTIRELRLALEAQEKHGLKDFVVPIKIDQFPFQSMQAPLPDLNCVRFDENWSTGLSQLLRLLERESAPKSPHAGPTCVTEWYKRSRTPKRQIVVSNERCHSNWFRFKLPPLLYFHAFQGTNETLLRLASQLPFPNRVHGTYLATFGALHQIDEHLGSFGQFSNAYSLDTPLFIEQGSEELQIAPFDANNIIGDLIRQSWDSYLTNQGLGTHLLASGLTARFFVNGHLEKNRAYYRALGGRRAYRQLVGNKSKRTLEGKKEPDGFWHYALSASPQLSPFPRLVLRHHVIFTDDGIVPWDKPDRMHKARRSVCKQWWNREWRDRLFAFVGQLAHNRRELHIQVSDTQTMIVSMIPMSFISPWRYFEDGEEGLDETVNIELVEEETEEDDDDSGTS
jgi:hypothetical protein